MVKPSTFRFLTALGVAVIAAASFAQVPVGPGKGKVGETTTTDPVLAAKVARTLIVGIKDSASIPAFKAALPSGATVTNEIGRLNIEIVEFPDKASADQGYATIKAMKMVKYVDHDGIQKALGWPNDPLYARQFSHSRTNTSVAWGISTGSSAITVAVVDTGIDLAHPEFAGRIVNPMSFTTPTVQDVNGHGTHCAGIASAEGNNGVGVAGVSWKSMIMPIKGLSDGGSGSESNLLAALTAAADAGANVISYSIGGYRFQKTVPQSWIDVVDYMHSKNCVFVAASGNDGVNIDTLPTQYGVVEIPCSNPATFAVASSNSRLLLSSFSNFGKTLVDVVAPGENILSTLPGGYGLESGTSMACPYVSGVSALVLAVGGTSLTPAEVETLIKSNAAKSPTGCANGLVNTLFALRGAAANLTFDLTPTSVNVVYGSVVGGTSADLDVLDDSFFTVQSTNVPVYGPVVVYDTSYDLGDTSNVHSVMLRQVVKASAPTNSTLLVWDPVGLKWVTFSSDLITSATKNVTTFLYRTDLDKYVDGNGILKVRYNGMARLRRFGEAGTTYTVSTDGQGLKLFMKDGGGGG